jgi:hypothetical protein
VSAEFLSGATMVASTVIALFFLRYWRETRDRLFLMVAGGFFNLRPQPAASCVPR